MISDEAVVSSQVLPPLYSSIQVGVHGDLNAV